MANNSFATFFGAVYPAESDVLDTAPQYGDSENVLNGSYDPGGAGTIPNPSDVRFGVEVGQTTGLAHIPTPGTVLLGVNVDQTLGIVRLPQDYDVRLSVAFGPDDAVIGTVRVPPVEKVELGYAYDSSDSLTGTLDPGAGGPYPAEADVRYGVAYGTTQQGLAYIPSAAEVLLGVNVDQSTGTVRLPGVNDVRLSVAFGPGDAVIGTVRVPPVEKVELDYAYDAGDSLTGTLDPGAGGPYPAEADVRYGVAYGTTQQGLAYIPSDAEVLLGVNVDQSTGTVRLPGVNDVRIGAIYGPSDSLTGTVTLPAEADVRAGTQYDSNLSKTGLLDVTGAVPIFPAQSDVRLGVTYGTEDDPEQFTGNVREAPVDVVELGYAYGSLDSLIGELVVGTSGSNIVEQDVFITRGDDISLTWELSENWPDLTGATFKYGHNAGAFEKDMSMGPDGLILNLSAEETGAMRFVYAYDVQATLAGGEVVTLARGSTYIAETETDPPVNAPIERGWIG